MPLHRCVLLLAALAACGGEPRDHGPPPPEDHQATVREVQDRVFAGRYALEAPSSYRFEAPVQDRVARWHFEPEPAVPGQGRSFGNVYGWRVDFHVRPHYASYPEQPESRRMAFFAGGQLRGIFMAGGGSAPLELDKWAAAWVDADWQAPPTASR